MASAISASRTICRNSEVHLVRGYTPNCGCSPLFPWGIVRAFNSDRSRRGLQIEITENKTPGDEQFLDPPGAELLSSALKSAK